MADKPWEDLTDPERIEDLRRALQQQFGFIQRLGWELGEAQKAIEALATEVADLRATNPANPPPAGGA